MKEEVPMKKRSFVITSLLVLSLVAAAQVVRAQETLVVSIPFDFVAGSATLPAGEYRVQKLDRNPAVLLIHCSEPTVSAMVMTNAAQAKEPQSDSKLVFHRYGNHYLLSQVWTAGSIRGSELLKSAREKAIAQSARLETHGQVTLVASLSPAQR